MRNAILRIVDYIKEHKTITVRECEKYLGTTELRKCISDMRDAGFVIGFFWDVGENRFGEPTRFKRYSIIKYPKNFAMKGGKK